MTDIFARVKHLFGSEADWASNDIVLLAGEIGFADVGGVILGKIGDGVSQFSELEYVLGNAAVPLEGTSPGYNITGTVTWENSGVGREFSIGIEEGGGIDNLVIDASGGVNATTASIYLRTNSLPWEFAPDGFIYAPDISYVGADDTVLTNKAYVDAQVAGGVSATYVPLAGNLGGDPVTGGIEFYNATLDKEFQMGIVEGVGYDNFIITGSGTNVVECSVIIESNFYQYYFSNAGKLFLPDVALTTADTLAAVTKAFVDELRQDCIDAGVVIPAVV